MVVAAVTEGRAKPKADPRGRAIIKVLAAVPAEEELEPAFAISPTRR